MTIVAFAEGNGSVNDASDRSIESKSKSINSLLRFNNNSNYYVLYCKNELQLFF